MILYLVMTTILINFICFIFRNKWSKALFVFNIIILISYYIYINNIILLITSILLLLSCIPFVLVSDKKNNYKKSILKSCLIGSIFFVLFFDKKIFELNFVSTPSCNMDCTYFTPVILVVLLIGVAFIKVADYE